MSLAVESSFSALEKDIPVQYVEWTQTYRTYFLHLRVVLSSLMPEVCVGQLVSLVTATLMLRKEVVFI